MITGRKIIEVGSYFHSNDSEVSENFEQISNNCLWLNSGRNSLLWILKSINADNKRILVPSYYCSDVTDVLHNYNLVTYEVDPLTDKDECLKLKFFEGDILLRVSFFGMRKFKAINTNKLITIIEDHTHSYPAEWVRESSADWCFASLRKIYPIADGGVVWSPKDLSIKNEGLKVNDSRLVDLRYEAMDLKQRFLNGENVKKMDFLNVFKETEIMFARLSPGVLSKRSFEIIKKFNVNLHLLKQRNFEILKNKLFDLPISVLYPESEECIPFGFLFCTESENVRDSLHNYLIKKGVYPAILWPGASSKGANPKKISNRIMMLHIDFRYSISDMNWVANHLIDYFNEVKI